MPGFSRLAVVVLTFAAGGLTGCRSSSDPQAEADMIRAMERERLRALVEGNMDVARQLHAADFQLINPAGVPSTKEEYLGALASGEIDYLIWEPKSIAVRVHGEAAIIRYQSQLQIVIQGQDMGLRPHWHTDLYERRNGRWQVVWSQATVVNPR